MPTTGLANLTATGQTESTSDPVALKNKMLELTDEQVRKLFVERLDMEAAENSSEDDQLRASTFIQNTVHGIGDSVSEAVKRLPLITKNDFQAWRNLGNSFEGQTWTTFLLIFFVAAALGLFAEKLITKTLLPLLYRLEPRYVTVGLGSAFLVFAVRSIVIAISIIVFFLVSHTVLETLLEGKALEFGSKALLMIVVLTRLVGGALGLVLSPQDPSKRLVNLDDRTAKRIYWHALVVAALTGLSGIVYYVSIDQGVPRGLTRLGFWLNLLINLYYIGIAWHARKGLPSLLLLKHEINTPSERWFAARYPLYIIGVVIFTWILVEALVANRLMHLVGGGRHYVFMVLLICAPALDSMVRAFASHFMPPIQGEGLIATRAYESTKRSYIRIGRVFLVAAVLIAVIELWNIDIFKFAGAGFGRQFVLTFLDTIWVVLGGYFMWELATLLMNRKLAAEQTAAGLNLEDEEIGGEGGGAGSSRLSTVLPLLRWAVQTVIVTSTVFLTLGKLGVDTTPLLAGAGVVGLAIGFGAQKLVTDVVSGIFFLIDDAFRSGEYVDVEGTVGTVEKISLRSMQLRHHRGPVHTIPYGEIPKVTNFSRDWVIMKLRFTVPFDTDLHKVKKIFKKIGQDLMEVPEFKQDLLQPFKSQGVIEVDDVGIVIRGKFMAKPGKQFTLRKEVYQRVQQAFDENGLQFARKEVRVKVDGPTTAELSDEDKQAIAAAAAESADNAASTPAK